MVYDLFAGFGARVMVLGGNCEGEMRGMIL